MPCTHVHPGTPKRLRCLVGRSFVRWLPCLLGCLLGCLLAWLLSCLLAHVYVCVRSRRAKPSSARIALRRATPCHAAQRVDETRELLALPNQFLPMRSVTSTFVDSDSEACVPPAATPAGSTESKERKYFHLEPLA